MGDYTPEEIREWKQSLIKLMGKKEPQRLNKLIFDSNSLIISNRFGIFMKQENIEKYIESKPVSEDVDVELRMVADDRRMFS